MDERQTIILKDNQCWHERRRNEGKILTFRGLSGCKAMPGWQGGFAGSKKVFGTDRGGKVWMGAVSIRQIVSLQPSDSLKLMLQYNCK